MSEQKTGSCLRRFKGSVHFGMCVCGAGICHYDLLPWDTGRLLCRNGSTGSGFQCRTVLLINSAFYIPLAFVNIVRFLIQGMGYSKFAILAGVFEMVARTLVGFAFVPVFGYVAACFASPVAWIFADAFYSRHISMS